MADSLTGKSIALLAADGFEDSELMKPMQGVKEAGATVIIVSNGKDTIEGKNGTKVDVDVNVQDVNAADFNGLLLPGGVHNPDVMRTVPEAVKFVRDFFELHKPVAAICHAPWMLIEADVVRGRKVTSWPSLKTDLMNAGAEWVDEEVVTDSGLVTSRNPDDIPAFIAKAIEEFAEGEHDEQTA